MNNYKRYKRLESIALPDDNIDKKISNLVRVLRVIGIKTDASCEGHLDDERHQHPWVGFNPFSFANIALLEILVDNYNKNHKIKWGVDNSWLRPLSYTKLCTSCDDCDSKGLRITNKELLQLQQSADRLAQYVFKQYKLALK